MDMNMDISDEWRSAAGSLSETERAPYDDPQTYNDLIAADGTRL